MEMETTVAYWGYIGIVEEMQADIMYWGYIYSFYPNPYTLKPKS